jgi:hypothetical protein
MQLGGTPGHPCGPAEGASKGAHTSTGACTEQHDILGGFEPSSEAYGYSWGL